MYDYTNCVECNKILNVLKKENIECFYCDKTLCEECARGVSDGGPDSILICESCFEKGS